MAHKGLYFDETLHWSNTSQQVKNRILAGSTIGGSGSSSVVVINNGISVQCGVAILVNGKVQIWSGDQGLITLSPTSRIGFSVATYDNIDVPILAYTNRVNGVAGVATFIVISKKGENSSFTWWIFN